MEATAACSASLASSPLPHRRSRVRVVVAAARRKGPSGAVAAAASTGNYVVPLDAAPSGITRPLVEILRDLNKRVPETIVLPASRRASASDPVIPWYHANRMLSFYAPGWCGEVRDVIYNDNGKVTVVYRVTIRGIDGEVHREAAGTASLSDARLDDPVAAAEEAAFCKACARLGFGLYLYYEDEVL
ncbi:DNA repair RAD52-like protein 2, chloroplastic isoform X2 [Triticum aestivum]|uniref:DNA repair RAD52-like protein 2, chloroplastic isoform X2 n=1 Tax=Triticum aestivum TaxID=4565 RepID=UPI000989C0EE|nr:DNA repair RAD52-like protein 2, chloroplastic isoform X2 [Triticum aestivum]